jgi:hypothetical protein
MTSDTANVAASIKIFLTRPIICVIAVVGLRYSGISDEDQLVGKNFESIIRTKFLEMGRSHLGPPISIQARFNDIDCLTKFIIDLEKNPLAEKYQAIIANGIQWHREKYQNKSLSEITVINTVIEKNVFIAVKKRAHAIAVVAVTESAGVLSMKFPNFPRDWRPDISMNWSKNRKLHWGLYDPGKIGSFGHISLAMSSIMTKEALVVEYLFNDESHMIWPDIPHLGGFKSAKWTDHVMAHLLSTISTVACQYYFHAIDPLPDYAQNEKSRGRALMLSELRAVLLAR